MCSSLHVLVAYLNEIPDKYDYNWDLTPQTHDWNSGHILTRPLIYNSGFAAHQYATSPCVRTNSDNMALTFHTQPSYSQYCAACDAKLRGMFCF